GTIVARGLASWQMAQSAKYNASPYLLSPFLTWQSAQSPLKIACRSAFAIITNRSLSASVNATTLAGSIVIRKKSCLVPLSVMNLTSLNRVPFLPVRSTVIGTSPWPPGGITQGVGGNCAVVQPQDG